MANAELINVDLIGTTKMYGFDVGGRFLRLTNGECKDSRFTAEEIGAAKAVVAEYEEGLPGLVADSLNVLRERGVRNDAHGVEYRDGNYSVEVNDYNQDGRVDMLLLRSSGNFYVRIRAEDKKLFCGNSFRYRIGKCACNERSLFSGYSKYVMENAFSDTSKADACISKGLSSSVLGCHIDKQVEVVQIDRFRRGVKEYLGAFDELFK